MFGSKYLVRSFAKCNKISPKFRRTPSVFISDIASFSCSPLQKLLIHTRNDINGFINLKPITKLPVIRSGGKFFSKFSDEKCWKCEKYLEIKDFTCVACGALQFPKKEFNYFDLFGVSQAFEVDLEELSKKFKQLQATFHPDKFVGKTKAETDLSETYSKLANKAYSTLKDPVKRGFYLLALQKYPDNNVLLNQEFLTQVMTKNEEIDSLTSESGLEKFRLSLTEESDKYLEVTKQAFRSGNLYEAKLNLSKLTYLASMINRIKEKVNKLQETKSS